MHLQCECDSHHHSAPAAQGEKRSCTPENDHELQRITQPITRAYPDLPTRWELHVFDALIKLNTFYDVETVAFILLRDSLFLTCAQSSRGWRQSAQEENQVLAIVDAELAMRSFHEIFP